MSTIPPPFVLTRTSLIMNRVPRSRTVSPDLMYFACSIIFTVLLTISSTRGRENKMYVRKIISSPVLVLTFGDIRLTSQQRPGLSGKGEKRSGQPPMNGSKQSGMTIKPIVVLLVGLVLASVQPAEAQQSGIVARIGFLDNSTAAGIAVFLEAFRQELSKLGWIEGKTITIEYRFAEQKNERLPELAAELVRLKVDLLGATTTPSALVAKSATTTIPIVMVSAADPVSAGLVASLARPGGNVTGLTSLAIELNTKRLEILKDAV